MSSSPITAEPLSSHLLAAPAEGVVDAADGSGSLSEDEDDALAPTMSTATPMDSTDGSYTDLLNSPAAPPTRRRGSVLDDSIMREMLANRVAPVDAGTEDKQEVERMERMYVMLKWSKKYKRTLVRDANANWDAGDITSSADATDDRSTLQDGDGNSAALSLDQHGDSQSVMRNDMRGRRSSMHAGAFGAGRMFAESELDAALAEMGPVGDEATIATSVDDDDTGLDASHPSIGRGRRRGTLHIPHADALAPSEEASLRSSNTNSSLVSVQEASTAGECSLSIGSRRGTDRRGVLRTATRRASRPRNRVQFAEKPTMIPVSDCDDDDSAVSGDESHSEENDKEMHALQNAKARELTTSAGAKRRAVTGSADTLSSGTGLATPVSPQSPSLPGSGRDANDMAGGGGAVFGKAAVRKLAKAFKRAFSPGRLTPPVRVHAAPHAT
ncbi:hypothetical protein HDU87_007861 [Geranomyces variabilis]|uniref:Uncharacterized protein n=1 Tax=Geranomyces variabilis TaxID=109894 RepID=A0AAD5TDL2_9FUNG|nr:hypothetical protein HDU87_007861 [Geranomyces variabilis]